jgi:hypothetical protein
MSATAIELGHPALALRRRELFIGAAVTAALAALLVVLGPAPADAPAHLYRTLLVRDGTFIWDNYWYDGSYPLASYSLLYYLPAALVGNLPLVFVAAVASTVLFGLIAFREWGVAALWPARLFGVCAAAPLFTGLYAYSLGFTAMLGALRALQSRRTWLCIALAAVTIGFSPLAFAFLCLIAGAVFAARRRLTSRVVVTAAGLLGAAAIQVAALVAFPTRTGPYPFHGVDFAAVVGICIVGALLARRARGATPLLAFYVLWGIGSVFLFFVPSPLGDNWTRLSEFMVPVMLLTASLAGFRPRKLVALALAGAVAYNITPYLLLVPYRIDDRSGRAAFWQPAISFLRQHARPGFRVEVVPTASHWESYWIPKAGFALARGWYQQLDVVANPVLYETHLDAASYRRWLRSAAVEFVLVPRTKLDWHGASREARIVASPASGLHVVWRTPNWTIYGLPHPTPLLTGPGAARVHEFGHTTIRGSVGAPGRYLLRAHYSPYWRLNVPGCIARAAGMMTEVSFSEAGPFTLSVASTPSGLLRSGADASSCASAAR